ncbi:hypothetical protein L6164_010585 [Bauhinia variegata]|uniref:Uncharacterized protein n=1 Tax=Bauhinia variegata TaxID=167791 RepID=A0ACB9PU06_BAUVA|nr:hypothetical protein L6164_010585 [Bauhinia variegata]
MVFAPSPPVLSHLIHYLLSSLKPSQGLVLRSKEWEALEQLTMVPTPMRTSRGNLTGLQKNSEFPSLEPVVLLPRT